MRSTDFIQNSCFIGGKKRTSEEVLFHQLITVKTKIRIQNSLLSSQPALLWWVRQVVKQRLCSTNMNAFLHPPKSVLHPLPPSLWSCYTPKHPPVPVSIYLSLSHPSKNHLNTTSLTMLSPTYLSIWVFWVPTVSVTHTHIMFFPS